MSATKTVMVNDLDQFVRVLVAWHAKKVATLRHMKDIPEGTEATQDDQPPVILTGDVLKGFRMGLDLALEELGTLPFEAELEEVPVKAEQAQAQAPEASLDEPKAPAAVH